MRTLLTIPVVVIVFTASVWFGLAAVNRQAAKQIVIRMCEILFAAAAFALMFNLARTILG